LVQPGQTLTGGCGTVDGLNVNEFFLDILGTELQVSMQETISGRIDLFKIVVRDG
jgi:hypothetical protein